MDEVEFDIDGNQGLRVPSPKNEEVEPKRSFFFGLLAKIGVTDPTMANAILLSVAVIFFGISIFIYAGTMRSNSSSRLTPEQAGARLKVLSDMQARTKL